MGKKTRTIQFHGDPTLGAAESAPTAPHGTESAMAGVRSGPARFWASRGRWFAFALCVSLVFHAFVTPIQFLPGPSGLELKEVDGDLTIPIELLGEAPPEPAPPPEPVPTATDTRGTSNTADAAPPLRDAAADAHDSGKPRDAAPDANVHDASVSNDGGDADAGPGDADAGADGGGTGPRDPGEMIGVPGLISAGPVNVTLMVNVSVIRQHPTGAKMGPLLRGIPQWNDFLKGSELAIDPIRDTDWILIYGPSLIHTDRDAVMVHYSVDDALVDMAVTQISKRYDKGGVFDAGVPGVVASLGHADNAERVFLRGQPHVLAIVPKDKAKDFAKVVKRASIRPKVRPGEALRLVVKDPWRQISIPGLKFSESLHELRLWIVPDAADGSAEVFIEGDCADEPSAVEVAEALTDLVRRQNSLLVRAATRGLLNHLTVEASGAHIHSRVVANREQLEAILQGVAAYFGVNVEPAPAVP